MTESGSKGEAERAKNEGKGKGRVSNERKGGSGRGPKRLLPQAIVVLLVLMTFLGLLKVGTLKYLGSAEIWHIVLFSILMIIALQVGLLTLFGKLLPRAFIPLSAGAILFGLYKLATLRYPASEEPLGTLLGFTKFTKGIEYLIAIAFILGFIGFWQVLHRRGEGLAVRIIPVTILVLSFGALAYSCISSQAIATLTPPPREFRLAPVLVETYGPAAFPHSLHQRILEGNNCAICHHHSPSKYSFPACGECHSASFALKLGEEKEKEKEALERPDLARAYHLRCIGCHREEGRGPVDCSGCHTRTEQPPPAISHAFGIGEGDCLKCHQVGARMPEDHAGARAGTCLLCHSAGGER